MRIGRPRGSRGAVEAREARPRRPDGAGPQARARLLPFHRSSARSPARKARYRRPGAQAGRGQQPAGAGHGEEWDRETQGRREASERIRTERQEREERGWDRGERDREEKGQGMRGIGEERDRRGSRWSWRRDIEDRCGGKGESDRRRRGQKGILERVARGEGYHGDGQVNGVRWKSGSEGTLMANGC